MRKSIVSTLAVLACFSVAACGGSGSPAAPSVPVPPPVTAARFSVTQSGTPLLGLSPTHFNFRLKFDVTIAESAGLGGHVNYVRLSLTKAGREIERSEINANEISPNNVVRASSSTNYTVKMDFNSDDFDESTLTFGFSDDRGNQTEQTLKLTGLSIYPGYLSRGNASVIQ